MTQMRTRGDEGAAAVRAAGAAGKAAAAAPVGVLVARVLWLVRFRWISAGAIVLLWVVLWLDYRGGAGQPAPWPWLWVLGVLIALHNGFVRYILHRCNSCDPVTADRVLMRSTNDTIAIDLLGWTGVLHFTGGAMNPLVAVMVFELAIAASLLPTRYAYGQAAWASVLFAGLALLEAYGLIERSMITIADSAMSHYVGRFLPGLLLGVGMTVAVFFGTVFFTSAIIIRLRRVNRRLQGANAQLSALDLTKSRFLRTSSHQLRGPLAAIHSMVSAFQEAGGCNPKQNDLVARINRRAEEAMAQLDEMLLLSTIQESASETGERRPVHVRAVLDQVASSFAEEAQNKGLTFEVDLAEAPAVSAWEDALETIMEHLLGNAIKYTPSGGRVGLSSRLSDRQVEIRVSDTGIGIPPEQQEQVFREFFRATNARQVGGGTGLGLSIVKATVERLGGSIALDSAEGRGTTITVRLPIGADAPARSESPQELSGHEAAPQTRAG